MKFLYRALEFAKKLLRWLTPRGARSVIKQLAPFQRFYSNLEIVHTREWQEYRKLRSGLGNSQQAQGGVNIVGYLKATKGISEAARNNALALSSAKIPFTVNDYEAGIPKSMQVDDLPVAPDGSGFKFNTNLIHINPPQLPYLWDAFAHEDLATRYTIGVWYWELPQIPNEWGPAFDLVDEVWAASDFVFRSISAKSPVPVIKIPPCVRPVYNHLLTRTDFLLPSDCFLFICAYDMLSAQDRKNPLGAVEAFKRAFPKNDPSVGLVIKINNAQENPRGFETLMNSTTGYSNCYLLKDVYDKQKVNSLIKLGDAFISLHRSEGFGLIPAEAMSFGKPVILTKWSGNLDYMTQENSCGVDYKLIPATSTSGPYGAGQVWADPDIDHAAFFMKKLFSDREYYTQISNHAKRTIETNFSPQIVGRMIREHMTHLGLLDQYSSG